MPEFRGFEPEIPIVITDNVTPPDALVNPFNKPVEDMKPGQSFIYTLNDHNRVKHASRRVSQRTGRKFAVRKISKEIGRVWRIT